MKTAEKLLPYCGGGFFMYFYMCSCHSLIISKGRSRNDVLRQKAVYKYCNISRKEH